MLYVGDCTAHLFSAVQSFSRKPKDFAGLRTIVMPSLCSVHLSSRFFGLEGLLHRWSFDAPGFRDSSSSAPLANTCSVWLWGALPHASRGTHNPFFRQRALKKRIGSSGSLAFAWYPLGLYDPVWILPDVPDIVFNKKFCPTSMPFNAWNCAFRPSGGSLAPNTCIGGSGTWAGTTAAGIISSVCVDEAVVLLLWAASFLVPFCRGMLMLVFFALWAALCRTLPGRLSPLGRLLGATSRGASTDCLRAFGSLSPRFEHCSDGSVVSCKPRRVRHVNVPRSRWSVPILLRLLGFSSVPTCVWAAPKGVEELGIVVSRVRTAREFLPVDLEHVPPSAAERAEDSHGEEAVPVDPEPIQHSFARMQTEALLEAYGEVVNPPCLKVVVLFPDGPDIMVSISDVSGGLAQMMKDTRDAAICASEETDLFVVEDQAPHNVLHVLAVPKWVGNSLLACVLIDLSAVGGPSFASLTSTLAYRGDIDRVAGPSHGTSTPLGIFPPGDPQGLTRWFRVCRLRLSRKVFCHNGATPFRMFLGTCGPELIPGLPSSKTSTTGLFPKMTELGW